MKNALLLSSCAALFLASCSETATTADEEVAPSAAAPANIESEVEAQPVEVALPQAMADMIDAEYSEYGTVKTQSGHVDLNGDGVDEWLVYVMGPGICGSGGCPLKIFASGDEGVSTLATLSVTQMPVGVFDSRTEGWRDLAVTVGGGGMDYGVARVPYSGDSYASNPTVAPAELAEESFTAVIALPSFE